MTHIFTKQISIYRCSSPPLLQAKGWITLLSRHGPVLSIPEDLQHWLLRWQHYQLREVPGEFLPCWLEGGDEQTGEHGECSGCSWCDPQCADTVHLTWGGHPQPGEHHNMLTLSILNHHILFLRLFCSSYQRHWMVKSLMFTAWARCSKPSLEQMYPATRWRKENQF